MGISVSTLDDKTIQVTKSDVVVSTTTYDYEFLVKQRQTIVDQQQRDSAQRDTEIAEIDAILGQAKGLGIAAASAIPSV